MNLQANIFNEAPKTIGFIDSNSLIHICQIAVHKTNDALSNPEACHFAVIRSCGKQTNAFGRSVSNAAYSPPWSSDFSSFPIIATRQLCGLKPFPKPVDI